jgi:hypothetical protein
MQKALIEMNVQLSNLLSDLSGVSGMRILEAILEGKREGATLAALVEPEVKATPEDIAKSLPGKVNLKVQPSGAKPKGKKGSRNAPSFELRSELYRITGIDWAQVNGMDVLDGADGLPRGRPRPKRVPHREAIRQLAGAGSHQPAKWRQDPES